MDAFDDPDDLVPQDLDAEASRAYEQRTAEELREHLLGGRSGLVEIDAIDLVGSRPETLVVFRYHYRPDYVGRDPQLAAGPRAEVARLWEFAIDPDNPWSRGMMDGPRMLAATIANAFEAAELPLADPNTLAPIGAAPNIFPRL